MRCKRGAVLLGAVLLAAAVAAQDRAPKKPEPPRRLLRLDWLDGTRPPLALARRDIFSPGGAAPAPVEAVGPGLPGRRGRPEQPQAKAEAEPAAPALALRYAGYSRAKDKIVAIVLIDGQARAVEVGEALGLGFTLRKITLQALEIEGPDGTIQSVALEGEQR